MTPRILEILAAAEAPMTAYEIGRVIGQPTVNVSLALRTAFSRGLVIGDRGPSNSRATRYRITSTGRASLAPEEPSIRRRVVEINTSVGFSSADRIMRVSLPAEPWVQA